MLKRYAASLLDVIRDLHGSAVGTTDPLSKEREEELMGWLEYRLGSWEETPESTAHYIYKRTFDDHIQELAWATIDLVNRTNGVTDEPV